MSTANLNRWTPGPDSPTRCNFRAWSLKSGAANPPATANRSPPNSGVSVVAAVSVSTNSFFCPASTACGWASSSAPATPRKAGAAFYRDGQQRAEPHRLIFALEGAKQRASCVAKET